MKVEFLVAYDDQTWDTVIEDVPDHIAYGQEREPITRFAEGVLSQLVKYRKVVLWAVYSFPKEEDRG